MDRIDLLRVKPPPNGTLLYVYEAGTNKQAQIFNDTNGNSPIVQPILVSSYNIHFYASNQKVDLKFVNQEYDNGAVYIRDQIMFDPFDTGGIDPTQELQEYEYEVTTTTSEVPLPNDYENIGTKVYLNGILLKSGTSNDFVINTTENKVEFVNGWVLYDGDVVLINYYTS